MLYLRFCNNCGKVFYKRKRESYSQWINRWFCSAKCSAISRGKKARVPLEDRFWAKVKKSKGGCWLWTGCKDVNGYGRFSLGRNLPIKRATRMSWEMRFGEIPMGLFVLHACDNPSCVNPDHLMLGTQVANMVDASKKNRLNKKSLVNLRPGAPGCNGASEKEKGDRKC